MIGSNENSGKAQSEKILTIKKGQELKISVSDDMRSPTSFMHTAFRQAVYAVDGIVEQSERFHTERKKGSTADIFDDLFQYSGNIVAFSGPRGGGKTSTMLSFAKLLGEGQLLPPQSGVQRSETDPDFLLYKQVEHLKKAEFIPLSPIAPSMLGEKQSILAVVLSRLYSYVSRKFEHSYNISPINPVLKQNVSQAFQVCLAGLRGVKYRPDDGQEDFAMLQDVSDGMSLRTSFYDLTQKILEALRNGGSGCGTYLVLQLDDADSQLKVGYEVLEDLRKYLMLPNVIILTSADFDMLRRVVMQHYLSELPDLAKNAESSQGLHWELSKAASKYIDKLIPPSNLICLPKPENVLLRWGPHLKLRYGTEEELLAGKIPLQSLQADLLDRIFRKTGIIFVPSAARPHDILPTTLRGINQLLYLLESMKALPPFIPEEKVLARQRPASEYLECLADYIGTEYLPVADTNLQSFSDYFVQEWINARILDAGQREFLAKMESSTTDKVQLAQDYLSKIYKLDRDNSNDVVELDKLINELRKKNCKRDDLSLFFAIRMLITLDNHMWVLQQKRKSICERDAGAFRPCYSSEGVYLPRSYSVDEDKWNKVGVFTVFPIKSDSQTGDSAADEPIEQEDRYHMLADCLSDSTLSPAAFNLINIINFFLRLTERPSLTVLTADDPSNTERLLHIYLAQEAALRIAANWDMWDVLKQFAPESRPETQSAPETAQLSRAFAAIDWVLAEKAGAFVWDKDRGINESWNNLCASQVMDHFTAWEFIQSSGIFPAPSTPPEEKPVNTADDKHEVETGIQIAITEGESTYNM